VYSITSFRIGVNPRVKASDQGLRSVNTVKSTCGFERLSNRQVAGWCPGLDGSRSLARLPRERRPKWLEETGICLQELAETCKGQGVAARILSQRMSQSGKGAAAISAPFAIPYFKSTYLLRTGLEPAPPFGHQPLKRRKARSRSIANYKKVSPQRGNPCRNAVPSILLLSSSITRYQQCCGMEGVTKVSRTSG